MKNKNIEDLKVKDYSNKVDQILGVSKKVMDKFNLDKQIGGHSEVLNQREIDVMQNVLTRCLINVSELSLSIDEIREDLRDHYTITYAKTPALGNKLFYDHYFGLHKPYDKAKKYIWNSLFIIGRYKEERYM